VRAYATKDDRFPVHPTTDQLFGGETFDAYQSLGRCVGARCAAAAKAPAQPDTPTPSARQAPAGVTDIRVRDVAAASSELT
jgi:hypothetical protein